MWLQVRTSPFFPEFAGSKKASNEDECVKANLAFLLEFTLQETVIIFSLLYKKYMNNKIDYSLKLGRCAVVL